MGAVAAFLIISLAGMLFLQSNLGNPEDSSNIILRQGKCFVGINEVHVTDDTFFVELVRVCNTKMAIKKQSPFKWYKLVLLLDQPPRLITVADLSDPSLGFGHGEVYHVFGFCKNMMFVPNFNANGVQSSVRPHMNFKTGTNYILALVYNSHLDQFRKFKLNSFQGEFEDRNVDSLPPIDNLLSANVIDLTIFCVGTVCPSFSPRLLQWLKETSSKHQIPPPTTAVAIPTAQSLNRCEPLSIDTVCRYTEFRYGLPTPGLENNCDGNAARNCYAATAGYRSDSLSIPPLKETTVRDYLKLLACESPDGSQVPTATVEKFKRPTLEYVRRHQRRALETASPESEDYEECRGTLPNNGQLLDKPWIRSWLKVGWNNSHCLFYCSSCKKFFSLKLRQDFKNFDSFQANKGREAKGSLNDNLKMILAHEKRPEHVLAHRFAMDVQQRGGSMEAALAAVDVYEQAESIFYQPTKNLMRLQFTEIVAGNSYNDHYLFFKLLKDFEVNIGLHHYTNAGSTALVQSFSLSFRKLLLEYLVLNVEEFSIITDASTDVSNRGVLVVLIQATENLKPVVYFYRLLELNVGESADNLFDLLEQQVDNDEYVQPGFSAFFWEKIAGFVSDNANVMVGKDHSFHQLVNQKASKNVILVGCLAHKLQLTIQRAVKDSEDESLVYFKVFEKKCNDFYTYYMSWGSKRLMHLKDTAEEYEFEYVRLKKFFDVRWASSYYSVVAALKKNLFLMRKDLEDMSLDSSLSRATREGAQSLLTLTSDKTFVIVLHEYVDFLSIFKKISLNLQESNGVLVGKSQLIQEGIAEFRRLKEATGPELSLFLKSCTCSLCKKGTCLLDQIDRCKSPKCNTLVFKDSAEGITNYVSVRRLLYDSFINKTLSYFNLTALDSFEIFNPVALGAREGILLFENVPEPEEKLNVICDLLHFREFYGECYLFKLEYINLLQNVSFVLQGEVSKVLDPLEFIRILLDYTNKQGKVAKVLRLLLVLPAGSSDAERAFSLMNRAKSKDRSRLSVNHVDSLIRLQFNAPEDLSEIDYYFYAREFHLTHIRSDDSNWKGGRPKAISNVTSSFKSTLF